ncbi:MAG: YceI family protein [Opitutales bacterium]
MFLELITLKTKDKEESSSLKFFFKKNDNLAFSLYEWVLGETEGASGAIAALSIRGDGATDPSSENGSVSRTYEISQEGSMARFIIFEELRGEPVDVVGATDQVAGQLALDLNDLGAARMGPIQVNARTFATDEERRDCATRNRILHTDDHEYITFTPEEIIGLEGSARVGDTLTFQIRGNLAIRNIVNPAVFEATMRIVSPDLISGEATSLVSRRAYNLSVSDLPFLANVADEVRLTFSGEFHTPK